MREPSTYGPAVSAASRALDTRPDADTSRPDLLGGRFEVIKALGRSGNASHFIARDLGQSVSGSAPGRVVKLKVLADDVADDERAVELFCQEAFAASRLSHPNIVRASQAEKVGGIYLSTTEYSPGFESLRRLIDLRAWLEPVIAVSLILQVADALDYAHGLGVLHLNICPESVLIDNDGNVSLTDFGLGAHLGQAWFYRERSGRLAPQYVSPEQAAGGIVDHRSDLYSLGILLYETLTDRLPFDCEDQEEVRRKQITQAPQPPHIFRQDLSPLLSSVVMSLLEKEPNARLESAGLLRLTLNRVLASPAPESREQKSDPPAEEARLEEAEQSEGVQLPVEATAQILPETGAGREPVVAEREVPGPSGEPAQAVTDGAPLGSEQRLGRVRERFEPPTLSPINLVGDDYTELEMSADQSPVSQTKAEKGNGAAKVPVSSWRLRLWGSLISVLVMAAIALVMPFQPGKNSDLVAPEQKAEEVSTTAIAALSSAAAQTQEPTPTEPGVAADSRAQQAAPAGKRTVARARTNRRAVSTSYRRPVRRVRPRHRSRLRQFSDYFKMSPPKSREYKRPFY